MHKMAVQEVGAAALRVLTGQLQKALTAAASQAFQVERQLFRALTQQTSPQTWWYKKWVWEWIEQERLAELRDVTGPTIAFHIRGGDVFEADKAQV